MASPFSDQAKIIENQEHSFALNPPSSPPKPRRKPVVYDIPSSTTTSLPTATIPDESKSTASTDNPPNLCMSPARTFVAKAQAFTSMPPRTSADKSPKSRPSISSPSSTRKSDEEELLLAHPIPTNASKYGSSPSKLINESFIPEKSSAQPQQNDITTLKKRITQLAKENQKLQKLINRKSFSEPTQSNSSPKSNVSKLREELEASKARYLAKKEAVDSITQQLLESLGVDASKLAKGKSAPPPLTPSLTLAVIDSDITRQSSDQKELTDNISLPVQSDPCSEKRTIDTKIRKEACNESQRQSTSTLLQEESSLPRLKSDVTFFELPVTTFDTKIDLDLDLDKARGLAKRLFSSSLAANSSTLLKDTVDPELELELMAEDSFYMISPDVSVKPDAAVKGRPPAVPASASFLDGLSFL